MGITNSTKELSVTTIPCGGTFNVTLALTAEPDIVSNPTDIVLILDRSGSMTDSLPSLKDAAKLFIDIIDEATDGAQDGQIGSGSRIGIVSFADTATQDTQLITSVATLKTAVDALTAGGSTNHADAFTKALALFDPASTNAKVMVMFTDGVTTAGGPPNPVATLAKSQGVIIYAIGLAGNGGIDVQALLDWASDPDSAYVIIAPSDEELEEIFEDLARNITNPGATNIVIEETVEECFRITSISAPTKGTATLVNERQLRWTIDELGVTQSEGAALTFAVEHNGICSGPLAVNESITYTDDEGNVVDFGDPVIDVDCGEDVFPEPCPEPVEITIGGCADSVVYDAGDLVMESLGRILQLDVTLRNVCPGKRVALAIVLTEVDDEDNEYSRGLKTMVIPAHSQTTCRDVTVRCVKFVLPEELDASGDTNALCNERHFIARFIAHYIDSDYHNERENLGFESGDDSEYLILPFAVLIVAYSDLLWYNVNMRKLNKSRHSRYLLNLHIVWIPKYRRSVLDGHQDEMKDILYSIAEKKQWEILAVEVMPDHVHLFVSVPPTIAPCEVVKTFKGQSGRHFLMRHPEMTDPRYDNSLWAPSYFVASAGDVSSETIRAYIEGQYD